MSSRNHEESMTEAKLIDATYWAGAWSRVEHWAFFGVVVTLAIEFVALRFAEPHKEKIERHREFAMAELTKEGQRLSNEAASARADIAKANAETAKAQQATEELRALNLEHEKAFSPRSVGFTFDDIGKLMSLGPVRWTIRAVERDEPQDTANQLEGLLGSLKWERFTPSPFPFDMMGMANVTIWLSDDSARLAAEELASVLRRSDIDTDVRPAKEPRLLARMRC
jgi:hypothetical protein